MQELGEAALAAIELLQKINQDTDEQLKVISDMFKDICKGYDNFHYQDTKLIGSNKYLAIDAYKGLYILENKHYEHPISYFSGLLKIEMIERLPEFTLEAVKAIESSIVKTYSSLEKTRNILIEKFGITPKLEPLKQLQPFLEQPQIPSSAELQESSTHSDTGSEKATDNSCNNSLPISEAIQNTTTFIKKDSFETVTQFDEGVGLDPDFWGAVGEDWAKRFYEWLGYHVEKQPIGAGFDFLCDASGMKQVKSEVKARTSSSPSIRLTITEWSSMMDLQNQDSYELLIVVHQSKRDQTFNSVKKIIRLTKIWFTLTDIFSKVNQQEITIAEYASQQVEPLIGLQLSSSGHSNDVIINWKRLIESIPHPNIKQYNPIGENQFEEVS